MRFLTARVFLIPGFILSLSCGTVCAQESFRIAGTLQVSNPANPIGFGLADFLGDGSRTLIMTSYTWPITREQTPFKAIRIGRDGVLTDVSSSLFDGAIPAQSWSRKVLVTDFNNDGRPDFFSAATGPDNAPFEGEYQTLLLSQSNGKLKDVSATHLEPRYKIFAHSAAAADIRKTGVPDLMIGVFNGQEIPNLEARYRNPAALSWTSSVNYLGPHILRNDGAGNFVFDNQNLANKLTFSYDQSKNPWATYDAPGTINWTEFSDLNNDGYPDLIVGGQASSAVSGAVYFNDGNGGFKTQEHRLPAGLFGAFNTETVDIVPFDVNGDGALDLILSQTASSPFYVGSKIQFLVNRGNGQFEDETAIRLPGQTGAGRWVPFLKLVDLDGDGYLDLFCHMDYTEGGQSIAFRNNGQGVFSTMPSAYLPALNDSQGVTRSWLTPLDYNQDGRIDFLTARRNVSDGLSVTYTLLENTNTGIAAATTPSGWWWNPNEPGRGYFFEVTAGKVFAAYFLYDSSGLPIWYISSHGALSGGQFEGTLLQYGNGQSLTGSYRSPVITGSAGMVSVRYDAPDRATLNWPGGSVPLVRFEIASGSLSASAPVVHPQTGWWWNPQEGGRGFAVEIQGKTLSIGGFMYDDSGRPIWYISAGQMRNDLLYEGTWQQCNSGQAMGFPFRTANCSQLPGGAVTLRFTSTTTALLSMPDGRVIGLQRFVF